MSSKNVTNILDTICLRSLGVKKYVEKKFISDKWESDNSLYKKDLLAHYGCVNAVEFSEDGDLMVSGGDDKRVLCWEVDKAVTPPGRAATYQPTVMTAEHESNIFCLGFDERKTKIYSGGNDAVVIVHDLETTKPLDVFRHEEPVYGLSVHPSNSNIFLTACSDGRVMLFDLRARPGEEPVMLAGYSHAFHAAQFNPVEPRLVVTANQRHGVGLWDVRKPERIVLEYGRIGGNRYGRIGGNQQTSMYVRWNSKGDRILGLRRRLSPVLYRVDSPASIAQFDHPGYYNSCTMKSCCFGGPNDEYVLSGSDDFNVYMWRLPEEGDFCSQWVARAQHVLQGHRSIVNQVRYNHSRSLLASSGVEKVVKLWSVLPLPTSETTAETVETQDRGESGDRRVFSHEEYIGLVMRSSGNMIGQDYNMANTEENPRMMAFFDSLVQREIEGWDTEDSDNSEGGESEEYLDTVISDEEEEAGTLSYTRRERTEISTNTADTEADGDFLSSSMSGSHSTSADTSGTSANTSSLGDHSGAVTDTTQHNESQSNRQSSKNLIAELISKKRNQLLKKSKRKDESQSSDNVVINKILESARRTLRTDSDSSSESSSSTSSLLSLSSIVNRSENESVGGEANPSLDSQLNLPSTSNADCSEVLNKLKKRKLKILLQTESSSESDNNPNDTNEENLNKTEDDKVQFKKKVRGGKNFRRKSSSSESDS